MRDPALSEVSRAIDGGAFAEAFPVLRDRLQAEPDDVATLVLMARLATRTGKHDHAFAMLARAIELAPDFHAASKQLEQCLRQLPPQRGLAAVDAQLARHPRHPGYRGLRAGLLDRLGRYDEAIAAYRAILEEMPDHAGTWSALGNILETTGRTQESVAAYRRSLSIDPASGDAWWSLANIKAFRFDPADIAAMQALLARETAPSDRRMLAAFALGKALEDQRDPEASFGWYAEGNRLKRQSVPHNRAHLADQTMRARRLFTPAFFEARADAGEPAADPIFIVGLPRSGSTLVEQILASHPAIEGTMELPDLSRLVQQLDLPGGRYPEAVAPLAPDALAALGRAYLDRTRAQRRTEKPHFIDKLPANFRYIGFIRAILPNAKIVDVRRHPLACGFSCFRQHFALGFDFANDLGDIGLYYRNYVALMGHWDAVLPGHVHRIFYEDLVADMSGEVRRLLAYLGLPFDEACLRPHETARAVRTPSASQVRQPVYRDALESWRAFDPWLGPLREALGDVLTSYPAVPT